jgi:hypothetical protein
VCSEGRALIDPSLHRQPDGVRVIDEFTPTEGQDLEALLEQLLTRLDELSVTQQP